MSKITEKYSVEIQEIMGKIPNKIIRYGLGFMFCMFVMMLLGTYYLSSPLIIQSKAIITTNKPSQIIIAKVSEKIKKIYAQEGDIVNKGDIIAVICNTAKEEDVLFIEKMLDSIEYIKINYKLQLGDVQESFLKLDNIIREYKTFLSSNYYERKRKLKEVRLKYMIGSLKSLEDQKELKQKALNITIQRFRKDSILYCKGGYGISELEYEKEQKLHWTAKLSYLAFENQIANLKTKILDLHSSILDMSEKNEDQIKEYKSEISAGKQRLRNSILEWKSKYILESSISGQITYTNIWSENQNVFSGSKIAAIVPLEERKVLCMANIPSEGIGKVRIGQKVLLKLKAFPYLEFGILKGKLTKVSRVPEGDFYSAEIVLEEHNNGKYIEKLKYIEELEAVAEIITDERNLLSKFVGPLYNTLFGD
jgi:HlyD family secretion protein